jgi:hypothetical protein
MLAVSEHSAKEWMEKYERIRGSLKNAKVHGQRVGRLFVDASLSAVAGVGDGVLQQKHPLLMGKDSSLVLGSAIVGLAMAEVFDGMDREAVSVGGTLIACALSRMTKQGLIDHAAKQAG